MEYQILIGVAPSQLEMFVNEALRKGWQVAGGVTFGFCNVAEIEGGAETPKGVMAQAMVRPRPVDARSTVAEQPVYFDEE